MKRVFVRHWRRCRRGVRRVGVVVVIGVCILGLLVLSFLRCRPIMTAFAESQAVWTATKLANQIAARVLQEHTRACADAVAVTYDGTGKISSVRTNTATVNTVRTAMTDTVITAMERFSSLSVAIPLGTLFGWSWFSGLGPLVTFPISFTATVLSGASTTLEAVGINQSNYQVWIHLEISLYVVSPGGRSTVGTTVDYPMAEVVLMGEVPDNLTEVYGDDQSLLGQIFDYGTTQ